MTLRMSLNLLVGVAGSVLLHGVCVAAQAAVSRTTPVQVVLTTEVELEPEPEQEHEQEREHEHEQEQEHEHEHEQEREKVDVSVAETSRPASAPAALARAGKTLTAPDAIAPGQQTADFSMVQGEGPAYAGGTSASLGTSSTAVPSPVAAAQSAAPPRPIPVAVSKPTPTMNASRAALPTSSDWNCSSLFPADPSAGNAALALVVVTVRADGRPAAVSVLRDPGHGFGDAARACAFRQRYSPALDQAGSPITSVTAPIAVRFTR